MKRLQRIVASIVLLMGMMLSSSSFAQGFMISPLVCGDPGCSFPYSQGVYTPGIMNSVLDHSMVANLNGRYPYKDLYSTTIGLNGTVVAFNGEIANGTPKAGDVICVGGSILLRPTPTSAPMVNGSGCSYTAHASYDEHPGYDYKAVYGTPVYAAAGGVVVTGLIINNVRGTCILNGIASCGGMGYVGIDHENNYVSQYGHLNPQFIVSPGQRVAKGQLIGYSSDTGVPGFPHLHFEVLKLIPGRPKNYDMTNWAVVDPYGWVGFGNDPIYSRSVWGIVPAKL